MSSEQTRDIPTPAAPHLSEILDVHAQLEMRIGEIYVNFAATFGQNPELRALWSTMALEEGGHAALLRAVNKGLLSGVLQAQSFLLPGEILDSLTAQVAESHRRAQAGASLDQALRITWELECSELNFLRELLVSSSNLAHLGFPTSPDGDEEHIARLREMIQKYTTDEGLRREVKFLEAERSVR